MKASEWHMLQNEDPCWSVTTIEEGLSMIRCKSQLISHGSLSNYQSIWFARIPRVTTLSVRAQASTPTQRPAFPQVPQAIPPEAQKIQMFRFNRWMSSFNIFRCLSFPARRMDIWIHNDTYGSNVGIATKVSKAMVLSWAHVHTDKSSTSRWVYSNGITGIATVGI